jgi:hypothetical protein
MRTIIISTWTDWMTDWVPDWWKKLSNNHVSDLHEFLEGCNCKYVLLDANMIAATDFDDIIYDALQFKTEVAALMFKLKYV